LSLGAAGAGMKSNDRVTAIIGTAEDLCKLGFRHSVTYLFHFGCGFLQSFVALFFTGKFEKETSLFQAGPVLLPVVYDGFKG
jgi:hypothetical protein